MWAVLVALVLPLTGPRHAEVHWLNKAHTHAWALTPYWTGATRRNNWAQVRERKRLCGLKKYGSDTGSFRVCETLDRGRHWRIAFTNHVRRGDEVIIQDGPISGTHYFDSINGFWRYRGVKYVSGFKEQCYWTIRSFNKGRNWRNVPGTQQCGPDRRSSMIRP